MGMKNICIITGTLNDYQTLKPLMREIQKDESVNLSVISTGKHQSREMEITTIRVEEEGFTIDERTNILFFDQKTLIQDHPIDFEQIEYDRILKQRKPDIVILHGNRYITFSAAIAATQNDIPIAHIQGGESNFGTWDDSYGYGITKLSHLHFTAAEKYRSQVIRFGEHSKAVFNVGSLILEKINSVPMQTRSCFLNRIGLHEKDDFILVSIHPDADMGSKNEYMFQEILNSLIDEQLENYKLVFNKPKPDGLGKMIIRMIDEFSLDHPGRVVCLPSMDLQDLGCSIKHCSALVGNDSAGIIISPGHKKPMINIGGRQKDRIRTENVIDSPIEKKKILLSFAKGLSKEFNTAVKNISSPFEKGSATKQIKEIVKEFTKKDMAPKAYYTLES